MSAITTHELLEYVCGDQWEIDALCEDAQGNPLDLTGAAMEWRLDDARGRGNLLKLTIGAGITVTDAVKGLARILVTAAQSAALRPDTYRDQLVVTPQASVAMTQWIGPVRAVRANSAT
jgi:hypothetical protein